MKRAIVSAMTLLVLTSGVRASEAASVPFIDVNTFGIELCPQSICGAAIFAGVLHGQVGSNPNALGTFAVAITHEPLPDAFESAQLTGGVFEFRVGFRRIRGVVAGGVLFNNGDNTFTTRAILVITSGGSGTVVYEGLLDHNVFPPTVVGRVTQPGS
jgi:hypothetical protein